MCVRWVKEWTKAYVLHCADYPATCAIEINGLIDSALTQRPHERLGVHRDGGVKLVTVSAQFTFDACMLRAQLQPFTPIFVIRERCGGGQLEDSDRMRHHDQTHTRPVMHSAGG